MVCLPPGLEKPGLFVISIVSYIIEMDWLFSLSDAATWVHAETLALIVWLQEEFVNPFLQNQGAQRDTVGRMPGD